MGDNGRKGMMQSDEYADLNPRVHIEVGLTVNTGNYESAKAAVGASIDVPPGMTVKEATEMLREDLLDRLEETLDVILHEFGK